ncbi:hypothetical protein EJB05_41807, partial [Eragrostis curvula]
MSSTSSPCLSTRRPPRSLPEVLLLSLPQIWYCYGVTLKVLKNVMSVREVIYRSVNGNLHLWILLSSNEIIEKKIGCEEGLLLSSRSGV